MVGYDIGAVNGSLEIVSLSGKDFLVNCLKCDNKGLLLSRKQVRTNKTCGSCEKRIPIGNTYGKLLVKNLVSQEGPAKFVCECYCGNVVIKTLQTLKGGKLPSCGCVGGNTLDITGKKLNSLTALRNTFEKSTNRDYIWEFSCDCGGVIEVPIGRFQHGNTKSCGCAKTESRKLLGNYHGMQDSYEYNSWRKMRERCLLPSCKDYPNYGGKGVGVCPAWSSFVVFYKDMGDKPEPHYTLDRIDHKGGYTKDNCRWASPYTQARNQGSYVGVTSKYKGVHYRKSDDKWVAKISMKNNSCVIGTYFSETLAAKAYNTATRLIFEGNLGVTHLDQGSEFIELVPTSRFMTYWLPIFKCLAEELYEKHD